MESIALNQMENLIEYWEVVLSIEFDNFWDLLNKLNEL